jgi:hypothetical protein
VVREEEGMAYICFSLSIPSNVRSYVSSKVWGNLSRVLRIAIGKQRCNISNWQKTHLNLRLNEMVVVFQ